MTAMYGDPIEELRYNKEREAMMRATRANPATESRQLASGAILYNETILRHLKESGIGYRTLDSKIPGRPDATPEFLGILYGEEIYIDHTGRLKFGTEFRDGKMGEAQITVVATEKIEEGQMVAIQEPTCDHGFVVRDIVGEGRFLCKECDTRFPRHPSMMPKKIVGFHGSSVNIENTLSLFREGMLTFTQAAKETTFSIEKFREAMASLFPPDQNYIEHHTIGDLYPKVIDLGEGPKRVSCYQEIEDVFSNPNVTVEQINQYGRGASIFPDVTEVRHVMDDQNAIMVVEINFVDGSTQRVEIPENQLMLPKRPYKGKFA